MLQVSQPAPEFTAEAVIQQQIESIRLKDFRGRYVVLFFWPMDFTFVCPTEICAFSDAAAQFAERNAVLIGVSTDSAYTHLAWQRKPRKEGGVGDVAFPMVADANHAISRAFGVLLEEQGVALRGLFLIDRDGVVRHMLVNDLPLGRSVDEALRMVDALQHYEEHGEVCPANWHRGQDAMVADPEASRSYFEKSYA